MNPLQSTNRRVLTWLCICPFDPNMSILKKAFIIISTLFLFASVVIGLVSSIVFFLNNVSVDLEGCLYAVIQITGSFSLIYMLIVAFISRKRINQFLETLDAIYDENFNLDLFHHLKHANDKSELLWKYFIKFVLTGYPISTVGMAAASVLYCYLTGNGFDSEYLFYPFKFALPWDQQTPIGYCGEMLYSVLAGETYLILSASIMLLFISISWIHQAFYKRFRDSVLKLDDRHKNQNAKLIFCELIRFHIRAKSWFVETADVYSPYVLIQLICSVVHLAAALFQIDLQMHHLDYNFVILLAAVASGMSILFVYCYFGRIASDSYEKMANCLFESHWYEHPVELQKHFVLGIQNIQQPIYYHGFGIANLELQKFTDMLRKSYQYYIMFKTITNP